MPLQDFSYWSDLLEQTLSRYREPLLRQVAAKLLKPRSHWPVEELIERALATIGNAPVIDRRLKELESSSRQALALIGRSRQPRWRLGNLVEMLIALGHADGLRPVLALLEDGLLYPVLPRAMPSLGSFEEWLGQAGGLDLTVFAHPQVAARAVSEVFDLPALETAKVAKETIHEADGLEWPLRMAVLWQQVSVGPLRRTQQGGFFKRDLDRLCQDPLLSGPPADSLVVAPDAALLAVTLAECEGLIDHDDGEFRADSFPAPWEEGLTRTLESLYAALPDLQTWNAQDGGSFSDAKIGNPFPSAYLLALVLLSQQPEKAWIRPETVEAWVLEHHPFWTSEDLRPSRRNSWMMAFLLGVAHGLRLIQATRDDEGQWAVRLSPLGRWLAGRGEIPLPEGGFSQTLFVQPNLEIVVYRQGLTPSLIMRLSRFAAWKGLGAACTLQLEPEIVYRGLETGLTFETILQTLEQHGMRPTPVSVIEALRTWAGKRDRITVYPSASLLEFASPEDLNEAVARGLPAVRLSECMALVANEDSIEYRHFRLTGTRDYSMPPDKCVTVEPDGVNLTVDLARSDLLLETELPRFAEPVDRPGTDGRRLYRLTPASLAAGRESGMSIQALETWFKQRAGQPLSAAALLLLTGSQSPPAVLQRLRVLRLPAEELADGVLQWPPTQELVAERLGPTSLAVSEENVEALVKKLRDLGIQVDE